MNKYEITKELNDGQVIATFDRATFDLITIEDWNGNDLSCTHWEKIALEMSIDLKAHAMDARKDF
jgi:hypothetical protein